MEKLASRSCASGGQGSRSATSTPRPGLVPWMTRVERVAVDVAALHKSAALGLLFPRVVTRLAQALQRTGEQHRVASMRLDVIGDGCWRYSSGHAQTHRANRMRAQLLRSAFPPLAVV